MSDIHTAKKYVIGRFSEENITVEEEGSSHCVIRSRGGIVTFKRHLTTTIIEALTRIITPDPSVTSEEDEESYATHFEDLDKGGPPIGFDDLLSKKAKESLEA